MKRKTTHFARNFSAGKWEWTNCKSTETFRWAARGWCDEWEAINIRKGKPNKRWWWKWRRWRRAIRSMTARANARGKKKNINISSVIGSFMKTFSHKIVGNVWFFVCHRFGKERLNEQLRPLHTNPGLERPPNEKWMRKPIATWSTIHSPDDQWAQRCQ